MPLFFLNYFLKPSVSLQVRCIICKETLHGILQEMAGWPTCTVSVAPQRLSALFQGMRVHPHIYSMRTFDVYSLWVYDVTFLANIWCTPANRCMVYSMQTFDSHSVWTHDGTYSITYAIAFHANIRCIPWEHTMYFMGTYDWFHANIRLIPCEHTIDSMRTYDWFHANIRLIPWEHTIDSMRTNTMSRIP